MPPLAADGLSDEELLTRMQTVHNEVAVAEVAKRLAELRKSGRDSAAQELHASITYRMHDLGEFMKALPDDLARRRRGTA